VLLIMFEYFFVRASKSIMCPSTGFVSHRQLNRQLPIRFLNLLFSQLYLTLGPRVTQEKPILVLQSGQHIRCREFIF